MSKTNRFTTRRVQCSDFRNEVFEVETLQIDETPMGYLDPGHGATCEGRLWVYRDLACDSWYFDWYPGHGTNCLLELLGAPWPRHRSQSLAWHGAMHTDGYVAC